MNEWMNERRLPFTTARFSLASADQTCHKDGYTTVAGDFFHVDKYTLLQQVTLCCHTPGCPWQQVSREEIPSIQVSLYDAWCI